jgi:hypothetical protein
VKTLWGGAYDDAAHTEQWSAMVARWSDAVAVGSTSAIHIFYTRQRRNPLILRIPVDKLLELDTFQMLTIIILGCIEHQASAH